VRLDHLWVEDFRSYRHADLELPPGLLVVTGVNGSGKTNLLEAAGWLARLGSFRGAPPEAMVRVGADRAVVRGRGRRGPRELLVETEITPRGRGRVSVNRQPLRRVSDLADLLAVSVFTPDDLELVKGGPAARRRYLDDELAAHDARHTAARRDLERIVRQRNALLRSAGGRLGASEATTLDVWDERLAVVGEAHVAARRRLVADLGGPVSSAYRRVAGGEGTVSLAYVTSWPDGQTLAEALGAGRDQDVRRGASLVGPHRDELDLAVDGLAARLRASQGEQRSLALALRLGAHTLATERAGEAPLLLLDDVFSELDPGRAEALLTHLPPGQVVLTTAGPLPPGAEPERVLRLAGGRLEEARA